MNLTNEDIILWKENEYLQNENCLYINNNIFKNYKEIGTEIPVQKSFTKDDISVFYLPFNLDILTKIEIENQPDLDIYLCLGNNKIFVSKKTFFIPFPALFFTPSHIEIKNVPNNCTFLNFIATGYLLDSVSKYIFSRCDIKWQVTESIKAISRKGVFIQI